MGFDLYAIDDDSEAGYFRAAMIGMRELSELMARAGVLDLTGWPPPIDWPEPPGGYDERQESDEPPTAEDQAFNAELRRLRTIRSEAAGLVPHWKFQLNEGWVVDAGECRWIAEGLEPLVATIGHPDLGIFVQRFIEFCRHCAERDGFEVW